MGRVKGSYREAVICPLGLTERRGLHLVGSVGRGIYREVKGLSKGPGVFVGVALGVLWESYSACCGVAVVWGCTPLRPADA